MPSNIPVFPSLLNLKNSKLKFPFSKLALQAYDLCKARSYFAKRCKQQHRLVL